MFVTEVNEKASAVKREEEPLMQLEEMQECQNKKRGTDRGRRSLLP